MAPYAPLGVVVPYRDAEERIASGHRCRQIVRRTRGLDNDPLRRIPVRRHVACRVCTLRAISSEAGFTRRVLHGMNMVLRRPILLSLPPHGGTPTGAPVSETASDPIEVIENMTHEAHNDARAALHALLAGPRAADRAPAVPARPRTTSSRISSAGHETRSPLRRSGCSPSGWPSRNYPGTASKNPAPARATLPASYSLDIPAQTGPLACLFRASSSYPSASWGRGHREAWAGCMGSRASRKPLRVAHPHHRPRPRNSDGMRVRRRATSTPLPSTVAHGTEARRP